ncbi:MAG: choice-of-anchor B family protein, partial [Planctomycetes bacterium]|nr:choice-of-anchor B family protein [Planctomycetota bacterium]
VGLAATLAAQGVNCNLIGTFSAHGPFNDVWGYTAPNGDEYALLCTTTGLVVVDITTPSTPVERGWFPWSSSSWRDCRTFGHYAYVVTEATAGFQIIDLQNPNSPTQVGMFGTANSNNAHNVCIDVAAGRLYLVGCNTGTPVYDLNANPANPTFLGYALGSGNSNYFHDLCVENGYAYGSMIYNGVLRIMNASNTLPWSALSNAGTPGNFTHNAWPNAAGTVCVTTDEISGGVVKFFDITNKNAPVPLGQYTPNSVTIPHNAFIVGDLCHVSWYSLGYVCIDISDPNNPIEVASYDTYNGTTNSYDGCWGCYPFLPSGNILASDRTSGLFIVKPVLTDLALTHPPLGNSQSEVGPYTAFATVTSSNPIVSTTLYWREGDTGAFTSVAMNGIGGGNYVGDIPGHDAPTTMQYYIEVADTIGSRRDPVVGQHEFFVGTIDEVFYDGFESDLGWTHGLGAGGVQDDWQRGTPAGASGTSGGIPWQDPGSAYAGSNVWANDLGGAGFNGSYQNSNANYLRSPSIATNGVQKLRLRFRRWLELAPNDVGSVLVNGTPVYTSPAAGINDGSWQQVDIDISAISDTASTLSIEFQLQTDGAGVSGGWALDEFRVAAISDCVPPIIYGNGTAGTNGVPAISLSAPAMIGTTSMVQGSNILANAPCFLALNFAPANQQIFGLTQLVAAGGPTQLAFASANGIVSWPFPLPNNPGLDNLYVYGQIFPVDPGSPMGLAATPGLRFRVCSQ